MAILDLTPENLDFHKGQFQRLSADSERKWGELTPERLCCHVRTAVEISLGDIEVEPVIPRFVQPIMKVAVFQLLTTWPKGKLKAPPVFVPTTDKSLEEERGLLLASLDRFVEELTANPDRRTLSPLIGMQPLSFWAHVHGVHNNHHYRQYGLV